jgi:hypothetical protein
MNELIAKLVAQLGVQEGQAKGGAGLLLKLAKDKLGAEFAAVEKAVPDASGLIQAAPAEGGASKLLGGLAGALGGGGGLAGLASLASGFDKLKLDPSMVAKFVPVLLDFVKGRGGETVVALLSKVLKA